MREREREGESDAMATTFFTTNSKCQVVIDYYWWIKK